MENRELMMGIVLAFLVLLLALMLLGWRARQRRQRAIPAALTVPEALGATIVEAKLFYVATTKAGEPLDRIAVSGLGYRARASVTVTTEGVVISIPGQDGIFVPASSIRGADRATWTIDRVVEHDGMVLLAWTLGAAEGSVDVDSYLRPDSPAEATALVEAITSIRPVASAQPAQGGNE